jgi:universal stress protein A
MKPAQRILIWMAATEDCISALEQSIELSRTLGAALFVLDVIHDPFAYGGWNLPVPSLDAEYENFVNEIRHRLAIIVEQERRKGFSLQSLVREGEPAEQIMKVVEEQNIDLLIMPAHEETRIEHFLSGKANEKIIRKMPCSILLMKQEPYTAC